MPGPFIDLHIHVSLTDPHGVCGEPACQQLLQDAIVSNVETLVITPHTDVYQPATEWQADLEQTAAYCHRLAPDISVHSGSELLLRHVSDVLLVQRGLVPTINQTKYVLIEFLPEVRSDFVSECVHELKIRGFIPLIAHPERYLTFQRAPDKLAQLRTAGAVSQGTLAALLGVHGSQPRQALWNMLKSNCIACLASDFHRGSYANMVQESVNLLAKQLGQPKVNQLLADNPARILAGERLTNS